MFVHHLQNVGKVTNVIFNPLNAELNPISYFLALLGAHHFLHVSRIRVNKHPQKQKWEILNLGSTVKKKSKLRKRKDLKHIKFR
jgi:hypothetical protein